MDLGRSGKFLGINAELAVFARANGRPAIKFDGGGHGEAVVVVGVLADQIDPARSAVNTRRPRKSSAIALGNVRHSCHGLLFQQKPNKLEAGLPAVSLSNGQMIPTNTTSVVRPASQTSPANAAPDKTQVNQLRR